MAIHESSPTAPKPFVFVLMPFNPDFADIYKFGIKGAAEDAGAYAERVDEQMFVEGILERIFNQISKSDVIVADMTGRNPNVFYEVGYAHALNKVVVLLTQKADDIPFDLKHRPHIIYEGSIDKLRSDLRTRLAWAIEESRRRGRQEATLYRLGVSFLGTEVPEISLAAAIPSFSMEMNERELSSTLDLHVRNEGAEASEAISYLYLFTEADSPFIPAKLVPETVKTSTGVAGWRQERTFTTQRAEVLTQLRASDVDKEKLGLSWQYRLHRKIPSIPPGAVELLACDFLREKNKPLPWSAKLCLRFYTRAGCLDFPFQLTVNPPPKSENEMEPPVFLRRI